MQLRQMYYKITHLNYWHCSNHKVKKRLTVLAAEILKKNLMPKCSTWFEVCTFMTKAIIIKIGEI